MSSQSTMDLGPYVRELLERELKRCTEERDALVNVGLGGELVGEHDDRIAELAAALRSPAAASVRDNLEAMARAAADKGNTPGYWDTAPEGSRQWWRNCVAAALAASSFEPDGSEVARALPDDVQKLVEELRTNAEFAYVLVDQAMVPWTDTVKAAVTALEASRPTALVEPADAESAIEQQLAFVRESGFDGEYLLGYEAALRSVVELVIAPTSDDGALAVKCPKCHAEPGAPCTSQGANTLGRPTITHSVRRQRVAASQRPSSDEGARTVRRSSTEMPTLDASQGAFGGGYAAPSSDEGASSPVASEADYTALLSAITEALKVNGVNEVGVLAAIHRAGWKVVPVRRGENVVAEAPPRPAALLKLADDDFRERWIQGTVLRYFSEIGMGRESAEDFLHDVIALEIVTLLEPASSSSTAQAEPTEQHHG